MWKVRACAVTLLIVLIAIPLALSSAAWAPSGETASQVTGPPNADASNVDAQPGTEEANAEDSNTPSEKTAQEAQSANGESELPYEPDVVLARLASDASVEELSQALETTESILEPSITQNDVDAGYAKLAIAEGHSVEDALAELESLDAIEGAQPNYRYQLQDETTSAPAVETAYVGETAGNTTNLIAASPLALTPEAATNDPYLENQWALESVGAYDAWDTTTCDKRITVAVIDSGCRVTHEDLANNIVDAYDATGGNDMTDVDSGGHGTHVAGIVAAQANNGTGVAGVSHNAGLLPIKVIDSSGYGSTDTVVDAYTYLRKHAEQYNVKVVNMSLGMTVTDDDSFATSDKLLLNSIEKAAEEGILTVCSSGNFAVSQGGAYHNFPSDYATSAVSVIALQNNATTSDPTAAPTRASYSNYNVTGEKTKNISAPGSSIYSTGKSSNSSYLRKNGTSMAAPCVAGIAALVFASNPTLTPAQVANILYATATDLGDTGWDEGYGYGEVNAAAAVKKALDTDAGDSGDSGDSGDTNGTGDSGVSSNSADPDDSTNSTDVVNTDDPSEASTASPVYKGASRMPVGSTCTWDLENCTLRVLSGSSKVLSVSQSTVRAKTDGVGTLGIYDSAGTLVAKKKIVVQKLSGTRFITSCANKKLRLDLKKLTKRSGTSLALAKKKNAERQGFKFKMISDGSYFIKNAYSKKYVSVKASSKKSGAKIIQRVSRSYKSQRWRIVVDASNRISLVNVKSGKALSVKGSTVARGVIAVQKAASEDLAQKWTITS